MRAERAAALIAAVLFAAGWAAHLALVWLCGSVPSVDYPAWLLQANVLAHSADPQFDFHRWYETVMAPVPNGGFVLPAAALARLLPVEAAGKIVLSLYIIGLPLAVRFLRRALGNTAPVWPAALFVLFNVSFVYGNLAFLCGACLLLAVLALLETPASSPGEAALRIGLCAAVFLAHAVCAAVLLLVLLLKAAGSMWRREAFGTELLCALAIIALALWYLRVLPPGADPQGVIWNTGLRYRLSLLAKSFIAGWAFPPYRFSFSRTAGTAFLIAGAAWVCLRSALDPGTRGHRSPLGRVALILIPAAVLAPMHIAGSAEIPQRLALLAFLLLLCFFRLPEGRLRPAGIAAGALFILVTGVRISDYARESGRIDARRSYLEAHIPSGSAILSLSDDGNAASIPFFHIVPKGMHDMFVSDYLLMEGGFDPLAFRTGYVLPRIDLRLPPAPPGGIPGIASSPLPKEIEYIVLDYSEGKDVPAPVPGFIQAADTAPGPGLRTLILKRKRDENQGWY